MPEWKDDILIERTGNLRESASLTPDILVVHRSIPPVAIETSALRGDADRDAQGRLGTHYVGNGREIRTAIAVDLRPEDLELSRIAADHTIRYALHQHTHRFPPDGFITGDVHDLARLVATTAVPKEEMEKVADAVASDIVAAANILEPAVKQQDLLEIWRTLYQRSAITGLRTTMVFVAERPAGAAQTVRRGT